MKKLKYTLSIFAIHLFLFHGNVVAQNTNYTVQHDTCLNKKFSIVFYLIQDSVNSLPNNPTGNPNANPNHYIGTYSLSAIISSLNAVFSRICVSFENCQTVIIPNNQYNDWVQGTTDSVVISNWYYSNTINFYIPDPQNPQNNPTQSPDPASEAVYGTLPSTTVVRPRDVIIMQKGATGINLLHTMGHYFGLDHTYAELSSPASAGSYTTVPSLELADGSNSQTNGDRISDTNADCYPQGYEFNPPPPPTPILPCAFHYDLGLKDPAGNYYDPPVDNIMSHYFTCRCRFTQEQYNKMAYFILTKRMYLH